MDKKGIFRHILSFIDPISLKLHPEGFCLPDELEYEPAEEIEWVGGAFENFISVPYEKISGERVEKIYKEVVQILKMEEPKPEDLEKVFIDGKRTPLIYPVIEKIYHFPINSAKLYQLCRHIFFNTFHRGAMKFAIAVMGLYDVPEDNLLFKWVALHDEFTPYCAGAIYKVYPPVDDWLEMAEKVFGWGRIHMVVRLSTLKEDKVSQFLIREGYKNEISKELTAHIIAKSVDLPNILSHKSVDEDVYLGVGEVLASLSRAVEYFPLIKGFESYPLGEEAVFKYLQKAPHLELNLDTFLIIEDIYKFLKWGYKICGVKWKHREELEKMAREILHQEVWYKKVWEASKNLSILPTALKVAEKINMDIWDKAFVTLKKNFSPELLKALLENAPSKYILHLLKIAEDFIHVEGVIDVTLPYLYQYPHWGKTILIQALESTDPYLNLEAVKVLYRWNEIPNSILNVLKRETQDEFVSFSYKKLLEKYD